MGMQEKPDFVSLSSQAVARRMDGAKRNRSVYKLSRSLEGGKPNYVTPSVSVPKMSFQGDNNPRFLKYFSRKQIPGLIRSHFSLAEMAREYRIFKAAEIWLRAIEWRNRNTRKSALWCLKRRNCRRAKKRVKTAGKTGQCCAVIKRDQSLERQMLTYEEIVFRLFLSALLGSIIGIERERLDWVAGMRTHMLVSVGATMFMLVSAFGFRDVLVGHSNIVLDPSRVAAQVVSGIGFLGAGTIIFRSEMIRGLTTAASLWSVAAVGLSVGGGLYVAATCATGVVLIILVGIKPIERRLFAGRRRQRITLLVDHNKISLQSIEAAIEQVDLHMLNIVVQPSDMIGNERVLVTVSRAKKENIIQLIEKLREISGVIEISHDVSAA
ncbi:MAG: MgtC/SapB family protein [Syntrophobacteraceae bacterium]